MQIATINNCYKNGNGIERRGEEFTLIRFKYHHFLQLLI